ncbi:MAG: hypothetical protein ALAOOOJD_04363 [bacterium]|nr:hypothetical protein [bacterium]
MGTASQARHDFILSILINVIDKPTEWSNFLAIESRNGPFGIRQIFFPRAVVNSHHITAITFRFENNNARRIGIGRRIQIINRSKIDFRLAVFIQVTPRQRRPGILQRKVQCRRPYHLPTVAIVFVFVDTRRQIFSRQIVPVVVDCINFLFTVLVKIDSCDDVTETSGIQGVRGNFCDSNKLFLSLNWRNPTTQTDEQQ